MTTVEKAIEAGYEAQITALYKALSQGVLAANGDENEITAAELSLHRVSWEAGPALLWR